LTHVYSARIKLAQLLPAERVRLWADALLPSKGDGDDDRWTKAPGALLPRGDWPRTALAGELTVTVSAWNTLSFV
jgi:hypothetical protein